MVLTNGQKSHIWFPFVRGCVKPPKQVAYSSSHQCFRVNSINSGLEKKKKSEAHACTHTQMTQMGLCSVTMWKTNKATVKRNDLTTSLERS